jgi:hypothetical protein
MGTAVRRHRAGLRAGLKGNHLCDCLTNSCPPSGNEKRILIWATKCASAQSHDVVGLVLGKATRLILAGSVLGVVASLGVARLLRTFLYGVGAGDPITLLTVTVLLVLVALSACYLPARRATRVDPLVALRYE